MRWQTRTLTQITAGFVAFLLAANAFAQGSNQHIISTIIDNDAPTQPTGLSATAVSSSQINLSWNPSTDNLGVAGYRVFRDLVFIATTTGTTYSNAGLASNSTYSYTVSAFDTAYNESLRSATSSATTQTGGGGGGTPPALPHVLTSDVTPDVYTAFLEFTTDIAATSSIVWGDTLSYDLGSTTLNTLETSHSATLNNLLSDTLIYYSITIRDDIGRTNQYNDSFTTLNIDDYDPPVISNVLADPGLSTSTITFDTDIPARANFSYGTTTSYEIGTISVGLYRTNHSFDLTSLEPETLYYYQIEAIDGYDQSTFLGNQTFTTDVPPDTTPPANVSGLTSTTTLTPSIDLSWTNPVDADFQSVRVMRSDTAYPVDELDGDVVYEGSLEAVIDTGVVLDTPYYYAVFARDLAGNYSSGAILTDEVVSPPPPPPPPPPPDPGDGGVGEDPDPPPDDDDDTGTTTDDNPWWVDIFEPEPEPEATSTEPKATSTAPVATTTLPVPVPVPDDPDDPFVNFPDATEPVSPIVRGLSILDFEFRQDGEKQKMSKAGKVELDVTRPFSVSLEYEKVPEVLKTLAVVMKDPENSNKSFTFLLRINAEKTEYEAQIAPLSRDGEYPVDVVLLNYQDQKLKRMSGLVVGYGEIERVETPFNNVAPVVGYTGIGIGVGQAVALAGSAKSFGDIWLLLVRVGTLFTSPFRRRSKRRWGVVYDSETKLPLDPAYVTITTLDGKQVGEALTDMDGRYGFILEPGTYRLEANKTHYEFPSKKLAGKTKDALYDNLYFGKPFEYEGEGAVVDYNIPLDPVGFDWNEYEKQKHNMFKTHNRKDKMRAVFFNVIFYSGLAFSSYTLWQVQSVLNYSVVGIYLAILVFQFFWKRSHKTTKIINAATGEPMPFTVIKAFIEGNDVLAKRVIADKFGQFLLLVAPGEYYLTIESRQSDGTYKEVHRTGVMELKRGVIAKDLSI